MKLPSLIYQVLRKTSPASATELEDINTKCQLWYEGLEKEIKVKEDSEAPLNLKEKIFKHADQWYMGIVYSIAYFWIVKFIQDLMNPGSDIEDEDHDKYRV